MMCNAAAPGDVQCTAPSVLTQVLKGCVRKQGRAARSKRTIVGSPERPCEGCGSGAGLGYCIYT
eukprot:scaffold81856_cov23-Tisochrysis_lutea.AAC.2